VDDGVFPTRRLAGVQRDRLHQSVALVEDADHGHSLGHRSHAHLAPGQHLAGVRRLLLLAVGGLRTAGGKRQREEENRRPEHVYSGVQGW
jgi:hypothetical protein